MYFDQSAKIYVAGHRGLAGSAICRELNKQGYQNIITRTHQELDLEDQQKASEFICDIKPDVVFLSAAKVGGIKANWNFPVDFLNSNLVIQQNVINASYNARVKRLIFLGSSCVYPKSCPQPIKEEYLLTSELEITNRPYALAKICGIELCSSYNRQYGTSYLAVMPTNLYGLNDNYDLESSHVLPALINKIYEAKKNNKKSVNIWGTGKPKREFLLSDDLANALVFLMNLDEERYNLLLNNTKFPIVNVGSGIDLSIKNLSEKIAKIINFNGKFNFDTSQPDGTYQKVLDVSLINSLGWTFKTSLDDGIKVALDDFMSRAID
jgi:GDP-L-fucose synthase